MAPQKFPPGRNFYVYVSISKQYFLDSHPNQVCRATTVELLSDEDFFITYFTMVRRSLFIPHSALCEIITASSLGGQLISGGG